MTMSPGRRRGWRLAWPLPGRLRKAGATRAAPRPRAHACRVRVATPAVCARAQRRRCLRLGPVGSAARKRREIMDEKKLHDFMGKLVVDLGGAAMVASIIVGEE